MKNKNYYTHKLSWAEKGLKDTNDCLAYIKNERNLLKGKINTTDNLWDKEYYTQKDLDLLKIRRRCYRNRTMLRSKIETYKTILAEMD